MSIVNLICEFCKKEFPTPLKRYNYLTKKGRTDFYCNRKCFLEDKKSKPLIKVCLWCKNEFESSTHSHSKNCCSKLCSSKYSKSFCDPNSTSISVKRWWNSEGFKNFKYKIKHCVVCGKMLPKKCYTKCCGEVCSKHQISLGARHSIEKQKENRRSKNEIYFSKLCNDRFEDVKTNEPMFNGWDADVILPNEKIAVLWNGNWHYKKLTKKHSVRQVKNRDKIKIDEIIKSGYTPYIIKDMGSYDEEFVKSEFSKLINFITAEPSGRNEVS